jgi:uncharacterized protein involved in exopolysaccharide biosynthesis
MEEHSNGNKAPVSLSSSVRDFIAIGFRNRVLMRRAFLVSLLGTLLAVFLFGIKYQSEMEVLIKRDTRVTPAVTPDDSARPESAGDSQMTALEMDNEQELMLSKDVLTEVVTACPVLVTGKTHFYTPVIRAITSRIPGYDDQKFAAAVSALSTGVTITPIPSSGILQATYSASDPLLSNCVTEELTRAYMKKHMEVNRPPKLYDFFAKQTDDYHNKLQDAEEKLLAFAKREQVASAAMQRDLAVQQASQFLASLRTTETAIAQTREHMQQLEAAEAKTDPRVTTQEKRGDNSGLLANLKSSLNTLELQRTELLAKYDPSYRTVQEVEQQIAQTKAAIDVQNQAPVKEDTTDRNPVYAWADSELAKARAELPALDAQMKATQKNVSAYNSEALTYTAGDITQQNLTTEVKAAETNYLLYLNKREQARISDMLDERRVLNVGIAEPPTLPGYPTYSPLLLVFVAFLLAGLVSVGAALIADYLDSSFRTPDEVTEVLRIPVFASIPVSESGNGGNGGNGRPVPSGSVPKNGH